MHIDKKMYCNNVFNAMIDMKGKTKDTTKVQMGLCKYCKRLKLKLLNIGNSKMIKPKA